MIFDNRDSYTYNLLECFRRIGIQDIHIETEKSLNLSKLSEYKRIVLGPGPGLPADHPALFSILKFIQPDQLLLGVCLGHEAMAIHYGGQIVQLNRVFHGDIAEISGFSQDDPIYDDIPSGFQTGLYHSWIVEEDSLPDSLEVTSRSERGLIMGIRHKVFPQFGFQFHPESYRTQYGLKLLENWYNQIQ